MGSGRRAPTPWPPRRRGAGDGAAVSGRAGPGPGLGEVSRAHLDVTDEAEVASRIAELPELDIVVCSAGVGVFGPLIRAGIADLRAMLEVHVAGTMLCAREARRRMQPRRTATSGRSAPARAGGAAA